ncbi:hypothetical protein [Nocardia abscessus]|uniref:hypothetical protein n=1 Tax=Nocardia abscessus TaxID=120957 RepID=UPI002456515E|nr:hypothetical protein [Nocardia abscessus]
MADAVSSYPEAMRAALRSNDMTSAAGFLGSSVFGLLLAMFFGVTFSARTIAGDEESDEQDDDASSVESSRRWPLFLARAGMEP